MELPEAADPFWAPGPRLVERVLPILGWARRYRRADLRFDVLAGVTLAAFAVPESLAYADLAGLHGMAVGGSLTRSSVNVEVGARTPLAGAVGGVLLLLVVGFFTGVFRRLPDAVLAAIILVAVAELIDFKAMRRIFALSRREFAIAAVTGLGVLLFGMLWGVAIGVAVSLLDVFQKATFPHVAVLGRIPGTDAFADRDLHPKYEAVDDTLIVRVDASLLFANAHTVKQAIVDRIRDEVRDDKRTIRLLILDLEASPLLDLSAAMMLDELRATLARAGITLEIAGANADARRLLRAEAPHQFAGLQPGTNVAAALRAWLSRHPRSA